MQKKQLITSNEIKQAVAFHGHLGPWLILGMLMGRGALSLLEANKYFGINVLVTGATERPFSCLIDGLQLSTGATFGKGNIQKRKGAAIAVLFKNKTSGTSLRIALRSDIFKKVTQLHGHHAAEAYARVLARQTFEALFVVTYC